MATAAARMHSLVPCVDNAAERRQLFADLFHALNQPLTTVRCSLELALLQPRTPAQYRECIDHALAQAERISQLAGGIRGLLEADDPGDERRALDLDACLEKAVRDWLPVAEASHVKLALQRGSGCHVLFETQRLRQALFHLLEFALSRTSSGETLNFETKNQKGEALLVLIASPQEGSSQPGVTVTRDATEVESSHELQRRLGLAIARRIFETAGGSLHATDSHEHLWIEVRLPLVATPV